MNSYISMYTITYNLCWLINIPNITKNDLTFPSMQILTSARLTPALTEGIVTILRMHSTVPVILAGREQDVKMVTISFWCFVVHLKP